MSPEGQAELEALYRRWLAGLPTVPESRFVETRWGRAHALIVGPPDAPPVLVPPGLNAHAPAMLAVLTFLGDRLRLVALDMPGQAGRSDPAVLKRRDDTFGRWLVEVADGLGLDRVGLLGISQGAFTSLRFASVAPARVRGMALVVPAGLTVGNAGWMLGGFLLPMMLWWAFPSDRRLRRVLAPVFPRGEVPDLWADQIAASFRHLPMALEAWKQASADELAALEAPVLVVAAEHDPFFSPGDLRASAARVLPRARFEVVPGQAHVVEAEALRAYVDDLVATLIGEIRAP